MRQKCIISHLCKIAPGRPGGQVGGVIPKFVNEVKYFHADLAMFIMLKGNYTKLVSCSELM